LKPVQWLKNADIHAQQFIFFSIADLLNICKEASTVNNIRFSSLGRIVHPAPPTKTQNEKLKVTDKNKLRA